MCAFSPGGCVVDQTPGTSVGLGVTVPDPRPCHTAPSFALLLSWRPCFLDCRYSRFPLVVLLSHGGYSGQRHAIGMSIA